MLFQRNKNFRSSAVTTLLASTSQSRGRNIGNIMILYAYVISEQLRFAKLRQTVSGYEIK